MNLTLLQLESLLLCGSMDASNLPRAAEMDSRNHLIGQEQGCMTSIKDKKLLYPLTSLNNVGSILDNGLQPRSALNQFHDVADAGILTGRSEHGLDRYVPFHWFSCNPFEGRVQQDRPNEDFVLITVRRAFAKSRNWKVLPIHPLARQTFNF